MADFDSSLPIRTQVAGDVSVKVSDATIPSQQLAVNADGSINTVASATDLDIRNLAFADDKVDVSGSSVTVSATDLDIRDLAFASDKVDASGSDVTVSNTVNVAATDLDIRDLAFATDKVDVSGSSVTVSATDLDVRDLAFATDKVDVSGSSVTVAATDLDIRDLSHTSDSIKVGDGSEFLAINTDGSINVRLSDRSGLEVDSYSSANSIAGGATSNHDYTATAAFRLTAVYASASGRLKIEVQRETAAGSNVFDTKAVLFNSVATPNIAFELSSPILVSSGARVRIIRTNRDAPAQDLYSTILGYNE